MEWMRPGNDVGYWMLDLDEGLRTGLCAWVGLGVWTIALNTDNYSERADPAAGFYFDSP